MTCRSLAGYHPEKDITVTVWCTRSIESEAEGNTAQAMFQEIITVLTPKAETK